jgi:hypothetical protein
VRAAAAALVLLGCSAPERIAANAGDIRTLAESSRSRFVEHADTDGVAEQAAIIEKASSRSRSTRLASIQRGRRGRARSSSPCGLASPSPPA